MDETTTQQTDRCCDVGDSPPLCCGAQAADNQPAAPGRAPCCAPARPPWVVGEIDTPAGPVPHIAAALTLADRLAAARVRLGIGRTSYAVPAGLCAVGSPDAASPVLVTANYKLSFDRLRERLGGMDAWILVLDTKGINVWCAAGKGTFGADEIVRRVLLTGLAAVVDHRTLIVPQLGAPGVAAHEVKKRSGFKVVYGPIRAADIPAFMAAGMTATDAMRRVRFGLRDRSAVVPLELVHWTPWALAVAAGLLVAASLTRGGFDVTAGNWLGVRSGALVLAAMVGGAVIAPLLLPILPAKTLSGQGMIVGIAIAAVATAMGWIPLARETVIETAALWLIVPTISAFVAMTYTGATTYTSLSGVRREMRLAVPIQIAAGAAGLVLWIVGLFLGR